MLLIKRNMYQLCCVKLDKFEIDKTHENLIQYYYTM